MRNPFLSSAGPRFVDKAEMLEVARGTAQRMAAEYPEVVRVLLFGSFARDDYGVRSDLDLLIVLRHSGKPFRDRVEDFLREVTAYPTDLFPYTEHELASRLAGGDAFLTRAVREGIEVYRAPLATPRTAPAPTPDPARSAGP